MPTRPPVLLFVPGLSSHESNTAVRVAEVIARSQSVQRVGSYSVKLEIPSTDRVGGSVIGPDGSAVLQVIEVNYRAKLAEKGVSNATDGWALLRSGRFALLGILRLISASRSSKTGRHRWFLALGFLAVLLLIGAFVALAIAALAAVGVFSEYDYELTFKSDTKNVLLGAALASSGTALVWLRAQMIQNGTRIRELVRYLERGREAASVALALDIEVDRLLDEDPPPPAIHILAYSFGSIVTLDALFSRIPSRTPGRDRAGSAITSLVTVGSPVDFVRQFYPDYFEKRGARCSDLRWVNLFLPEDVLGSNFLDNDDENGFEAPPSKDVFEIEGIKPARSIQVGTELSSLRSLLSLEGFRVHGEYWDEAHRANLLEPVIDTWLSAPAEQPTA